VAYVIYGKSTPFVLIDLKALDPSDGYAIIGVSGGDYLGVSVSGAGILNGLCVIAGMLIVCCLIGDVNGDGFDDIIIGALRMNNGIAGAVYIVYGETETKQQALKLTNVGTNKYIVLSGVAHSWFGYSVSGAGIFHFFPDLISPL
jgi:hypothetical protein